MAELCSCNKPKIFRTSWSDDNPGRRYKMCPLYRKPGGCRDFDFIDPFCPRCHAIIPGLLRRVNHGQQAVADLNEVVAERDAALEEKQAKLKLKDVDLEFTHEELVKKDEELEVKKQELKAVDMQLQLMNVECKMKEDMMNRQTVDLSREIRKLRIALVVCVICYLWKSVSD